MDAFDLDVFGRVGNDYEAIHTIHGDLERDLERAVAEEEVGAALLRLVGLGFVDALRYDIRTNSYVRVSPEAFDVRDLWFLTNSRGRVEYERLPA